jgi:hypothetical protein
VERVAYMTDESLVGVRAVTLDSVHNWPDWAALNAEDLLSAATQENATWRPGRIRWDTRKTGGGLPLRALTEYLLRGHQVGWLLSINRSWLAAVNVRPVVSVTGGVITYEGGVTGLGRGWVIDMDVAGWGSYGGGNSTPLPVAQHAITFEEIDDGTNLVRWYDEDHPDGMHASVTFEDLGFVGRGRGSTTIGPDTGWDR